MIMAKSVRILSICGSGTVTSSMVASKLKDYLQGQEIGRASCRERV